MNKLGVVLGIAAVATLAGCKNPDFKRKGQESQEKVKVVDTTPAPVNKVEIEPAPAKCTCPPGTKHAAPCTCGAPDCKCVVETKSVIVAEVSKKPVEPEYTIYVVQNGDYLAKISKKYNVTISSIKRLNPSIKKDVIRVGQKLKLPGKIDVGAQSAPVVAAAPVVATAPVVAVATPAKKAVAKKGYASYTGATKEYVVQNGDTLGSIAYGNGINIRQLKELNGLSSDALKIGQKLKVPAEKVANPAAKSKRPAPAKAKVKKVAAAPVEAAEKPVEAAKKPVEAAEKPVEAAEKPVEAAEKPVEAAEKAAEKPGEAAPAAVTEAAAEKPAPAAATTTYVVQEGDDMTGVSIRWGVSAAEIRELNNLGENDQLVPGQIIKLPAEAQL